MNAAEIHVDEGLLDEYILRRCDARQRAAVAEHLAECSACLARWIDLAELRAALAMVAGHACSAGMPVRSPFSES